MANKTDTEVIIGGKVYTLSGNDGEEYMQRIASYINSKISEFSKIDGFKRQSVDTQNVLLELNIADDYFKAKKELDEFKSEAEDKEKDLYDIKHDLITAQMKVKGLEENLLKLQEENTELQKKIVRLETEIRAGLKNDEAAKATAADTKETIKEAVREAVQEENAKQTAGQEIQEDDKESITDMIDDIPDFHPFDSTEKVEENSEENSEEDLEEDSEKEILYERVEDAEVIADEDYDDKLNNHEDDDKFVQTIDGTAEVIKPEKSKHSPKKHYGKRR